MREICGRRERGIWRGGFGVRWLRFGRRGGVVAVVQPRRETVDRRRRRGEGKGTERMEYVLRGLLGE